MANMFSFKALQRQADQRQPKRRTLYKYGDKGELIKTSELVPKQRTNRKAGRKPR